jgi:DNA polymerase-3 subunit delta'
MLKPSAAQCPPWLFEQWQQLLYRHNQKQMPHALLLTGVEGIGKQDFAAFITAAMLCENVDKSGACKKCSACSQLAADAHADYRYVSQEEGSEIIKVDAIRELVDWLHLTPNGKSYRVALLNNADAMNRNAANSILKTLEEPGEGALLILVTSKPGSLPATVLSRCQKITLTNADIPAAITWLKEQGVTDAETALHRVAGAPYRVMSEQDAEWAAEEATLTKAWIDLLAHKASVGKIVDSLKDYPTARCLAHFSKLTALTTAHHQGRQSGADPATNDALLAIVDSLQSEQWFTVYDRMQRLTRSDSASFKTQAVLEGLFADIRLMIKG